MSEFTCPMCKEKTYYGEYSQGTKVCLDCKKTTQADDGGGGMTHPIKEFQRQLKTLANLTLVDIKDSLELSSDDFTAFVHGRLHIDIRLARKLSIMTDTPVGMWISLNGGMES